MNERYRAQLIAKIEGHTGKLLTLDWDQMSTEDIEKISEAIQHTRFGGANDDQ